MPANPQIPKIVFLEIDGEDFSMDFTSAKLEATAGTVQKVVTLDGVTHQDAEPESWSLNGTCVQDWDSVRPGFAYWAFQHKGERKTVIYNPGAAGDDTGSTTEPPATFEVTVVPIGFGGDANVFGESTVSMPVNGDPTFDIVP
jgi:hypothetical protein